MVLVGSTRVVGHGSLVVRNIHKSLVVMVAGWKEDINLTYLLLTRENQLFSSSLSL